MASQDLGQGRKSQGRDAGSNRLCLEGTLKISIHSPLAEEPDDPTPAARESGKWEEHLGYLVGPIASDIP